MSAPLDSTRRWSAYASPPAKCVGDGTELSSVERAKRRARPWDYEAYERGERRPDNYYAKAIGVPVAIKIAVAVGQARYRKQLEAATAHMSAASTSGIIGDEAAAALTAAIAEKDAGLAWHRAWWKKIAPPPILKRVGDRRPRIEHRAKLAASGPMPPDLAQHFPVGQLAVLKIIADEVARSGTCRLTKKEMSDRARASETTVHSAVRSAKERGMIKVTLRPVKGRKSLPNLITITDAEWMLWIMRPKYRAIREDQIQHRADVLRDVEQRQGANRRTPQSASIYKKDFDGVWRAEESADEGRKANDQSNAGELPIGVHNIERWAPSHGRFRRNAAGD
jgi:hypothetical protein